MNDCFLQIKKFLMAQLNWLEVLLEYIPITSFSFHFFFNIFVSATFIYNNRIFKFSIIVRLKRRIYRILLNRVIYEKHSEKRQIKMLRKLNLYDESFIMIFIAVKVCYIQISNPCYTNLSSEIRDNGNKISQGVHLK